MWLILFVYFLAIVLLIYYYGTKNYDYWKKKGVKYEKPMPFVGNELPIYSKQMSMSEYYAYLYNKYSDEKIVGFFRASEPSLLVRDPELIKRILITDFSCFYYRGIVPSAIRGESMFRNLFSAEGDEWKLLRHRFSPAFSSAKLKAMFPLIVDRAEKLQSLAEEHAAEGSTVDIRDLMARFTTDFIAACGFGIETDALNDVNSNFRKIGKRIFQITLRDSFIGALKIIFPLIFENVKYVPAEVENGILFIMREIMKQRNYEPTSRNDFIDVLLELKKKGTIFGTSIEHKNSDGSPKKVQLELDDLVMAAQVYIFFAAGFETSSSSSSYTLHQLAFHPEEQDKVQEEIDRVLKKYDNKLCYDAINEMKYLEMAFNESLRLLPPVGFILRRCTQIYKIPGTDISIDPGTVMYISTHGLHNDEQYFENPDQFRPDRFHPDNYKHNDKCVFLPFGEGQRSCIGARLGQIQALAGLAAILHKFSVEPAATSVKKPILARGIHVVQVVEKGLPIRLRARNV